MLGFWAYEAQRVARSFRDYDEQTVRELAQYIEDKSQYIAVAGERIRSLNDLFEMERHRVFGVPTRDGIRHDFEFCSRALREKMRFDPCANPKDGLTEKIVTKLARDTVV